MGFGGFAALSILEETPKRGKGTFGRRRRGRRQRHLVSAGEAAAAAAAVRTNSVFLFGKLAVLSREMIRGEDGGGLLLGRRCRGPVGYYWQEKVIRSIDQLRDSAVVAVAVVGGGQILTEAAEQFRRRRRRSREHCSPPTSHRHLILNLNLRGQ